MTRSSIQSVRSAELRAFREDDVVKKDSSPKAQRQLAGRDLNGLGWHVLLALVLGLFMVSGLMALAAGWSRGGWPFDGQNLRADVWADAAKVATPGAALVVAVVAAVIAFHGQRARLRELNQKDASHELDAISALRDRYTEAAKQLGSDSHAIRLAGVYAMAALADDWSDRGRRDEAQVCVMVLCSYLRAPVMLGRSEETNSDTERARESLVRQTIIETIAARLQIDAERNWHDLAINLSNSTFDFAVDFSYCRFAEVTFSGAVFRGTPFFVDAEFCDTPYFADAVFAEGANFRGSFFCAGAIFDGANFREGILNFVDTTFAEDLTGVSFIDSQFWGVQVYFSRAVLFTRIAATPGKASAETWSSGWSFEGAKFAVPFPTKSATALDIRLVDRVPEGATLLTEEEANARSAVWVDR